MRRLMRLCKRAACNSTLTHAGDQHRSLSATNGEPRSICGGSRKDGKHTTDFGRNPDALEDDMARPTEYDPEYCDQVVQFGAQGKSLMWMAAELGVHRDTMYEWMAVHPEFSDAMKRARAMAQQWWEDAGQNALSQPGFNGAMWGKNMAARFADDWREKSETALTGANGGPVQVQEIRRVIVDPANPNA